MGNMNINLIGAFDRNNYGDLLFPIIAEKMLLQINKDKGNQLELDFEFVSIRDSDLSAIGAKRTKGISYLNGKTNTVSIITGGEVLGTSFMGMDLCYEHPGIYDFSLRGFNKLFGDSLINQYLTRKYKTEQEFPWIPSINHFQKNKVIYNSVGGTNIDQNNKRLVSNINFAMKFSSYFSVRDTKTKDILANIDESNAQKVKVSPDSAIIMSKLFPKEFLINNLSNEVVEYLNKKRNYIIFQVSKKIGKGKEQEIASVLSKLSKDLKLDIILLPIGRANAHEDHIALQKIASYMDSDYYIPKMNTIFDTMYLIATSKLYVGTSLHGAITAISYDIPHMAFTDKIVKLNEFLFSWNTTDVVSTSLNELILNSKKLINNHQSIRSRDAMFKKVEKNFVNIYDAILES